MASDCIKINWWNFPDNNECSSVPNLNEWEIIHYLHSPPQSPTPVKLTQSRIHVDFPQSPTSVDFPQSPVSVNFPQAPTSVDSPDSPIHVELSPKNTKNNLPKNEMSAISFLYQMLMYTFANLNHIYSSLIRHFDSFITN